MSDPNPIASLSVLSKGGFGSLLEARRKAAGLSRATLALQANLAAATVKAIELGRRRASDRILHRLVAVPALKLSLEVAWQALGLEPWWVSAPIPATPRPRSPVAWGVSAELDLLSRSAERERVLRRSGGAVPASFLYQDADGAAAWLTCTKRWPTLHSLRQLFPSRELAHYIRAEGGRELLEVWALGAGEGAAEIELIQQLLADDTGPIPTALWLFDTSLPLLQRAARRATQALGAYPIDLHALVIDLVHLSVYPGLASRPAQERRLFALVGGTLGELCSDARFLRHDLGGFVAPGDLLALDIQPVAAPCTEPDRIKRCDPLLSQPIPDPVLAWLSGPIERACRGTPSSVQFRVELDVHVEIPGSYALRFVAEIEARPARTVTMYSISRYDPAQLAAFLTECGWECVAMLPYGNGTPGIVLLLRRAQEENHGC